MCHKVSLVFSIKLDVSGEEDLQYFRSLNVTLICIRCSKTAARPAVSWTQMSLYHKTFKCNFQFVQVRTTLLPVFVFIKCISVIIQNINDPNLGVSISTQIFFFFNHTAQNLWVFSNDYWKIYDNVSAWMKLLTGLMCVQNIYDVCLQICGITWSK